MEATLRVVSWNIRAAIGPGPFPDRWWSHIDADRLRAIGAFIASLEPDIVALQEVASLSRDGDLVDQPGDLARQLDMEVRFGAVRTFSVIDAGATKGAGVFGNALLSRAPIRHAKVVALPAAPADDLIEPIGADHAAAGVRWADASPTIREPRCIVLADVAGLRVGSAHLSHVGSGERRLQAQAIDAAFDGASPALLLADLNARIEASELVPLAGWDDGFPAAAGAPARISTDDGMSIDQLLARGAAVSGCRVDRRSGELSDHYPIVADITLG